MALLPKTKIYTVHINLNQEHAVEKAIFVREGFNFMAFIFGIAWALYHKMWFYSFIIGITMTLLGAANEQNWLQDDTILVLNTALNVIIGLWANDLRRNHLANKGYIISDIVVSDNELAAQQRYFERMMTA